MSNKLMDFSDLDQIYRYCPETGEIRNKVDRGRYGRFKAGTIATSRHNKGYLQVQFSKDGRKFHYLAHRVAWLLHTGEDPGDMEIDHIDGQRSRNIFSNLRLVGRQENSRNMSKFKSNTSGVTGVYWDKEKGKWMARITDHGKLQNLGYFYDKFEAIRARKSAENRLGYHPNHGKTKG